MMTEIRTPSDTTGWPEQLFLPRQVAAPEGPVDMAMMYVAHHGFRRDLEAFCAAVRATPASDRATWRALLRRWELFSIALHHHHSGEDAWLWPVLIERAAPSEKQLLVAMENEHAEIDPALDACTSGLRRLAGTADEDARAALVVHLSATKEALYRHLAHEETETMALLQRVLAPAEWQEMNHKFERSFTPRQLAWAVPWIVTELPDEVRDALFAQPGAAPLKVVYLLFRGKFARLQREAFRHVEKSA
jgi:hemerythrin HHE cation binding domain-containing protein